VIEVNELGFTPAGAEAPVLKNLSFTLPEKGLVSVVGPNGAGKTTLLRCILALLPYSGSSTIGGSEASKLSRNQVAKLVSYIPQISEPLPGFSVREFVELARRPHLTSRFEQFGSHASVVDRSLELAHCAQFSKRLISSLSGGERQRVFIAAALAQETQVILMDEPGAFLDPEHEHALFSLLSELKREKSLLVVSHDLNRSSVSSDRVLALKNGEKFYFGDPEGLIEETRLLELFNRRFVFIEHPDCEKRMILPESENG